MKVDISDARTILGQFKEVEHTRIDVDLYERVKDYKLRIASKFKSIGKSDIERIQGNEFYISVKLDGEHSQLYYEDGQIFLIRPRGYAYFGLPVLDAAKRIFDEAGVKRALMPGELYVKRLDGVRTRVFDVISLTKSPKSLDDLDLLSFAPFDIIFLDDEEFVDYAEIWRRINTLFGGTALSPPHTVVSSDRAAVYKQYDHWVNQNNAEGLMIRSDLTFRYKLKAQHTIDAAVVGYTASGEMVTSVLTGLITEEGHVQILTGLEKGFSDIDRMTMFQTLSKLHQDSDYMAVSAFHTPFIMVKPKLILEFSCNDMLAERDNGKPIKKAALQLKKGKYKIVRSQPFVSLKHCVFQRFRDDKEVNPVDLRLAQVTDFIYLGDRQEGGDIAFPSTEVLLREVYIKPTKGATAVRKIVVWQTHKEQNEAYTRYALNFTDYSPGRKEPLKQDIRISDSKSQIMALADEFRAKNVKKGWENVDDLERRENQKKQSLISA